MSRDMSLRSNHNVKQAGFTVTSSDWTLVSKWSGVDREYFGVNVKGSDTDVRVLMTTDVNANEDSMYELNQGIVATSEWLFLRCDFYMKVANAGADTKVAVWETIKN